MHAELEQILYGQKGPTNDITEIKTNIRKFFLNFAEKPQKTNISQRCSIKKKSSQVTLPSNSQLIIFCKSLKAKLLQKYCIFTYDILGHVFLFTEEQF